MDEIENMQPGSPVSARLRRWLSLAALGYFVAMFWGTHTPKPPPSLTEGFSDKHLHFVAYGGLAFLVAARLGCSRALTRRHYVRLWLAVATYGALDELLQIPVGRDADVVDWLMDVTGAAMGLAAVALVGRWLRSRVTPTRP
jgi:VanZ family protein